MTSKVGIGETDELGFTLLRRSGDAELFRTPKGYYSVYLWVSEDDYRRWCVRGDMTRKAYSPAFPICSEGVESIGAAFHAIMVVV